VNLGLARLRKTGAPQDVLDDMREALSEAHRDIRTLTYLLYPPQLSDQGLESTLRTFVYGFRKRTGLAVETSVAGDLDSLPDTVQRAVFRVVLEALANVQRRAGAKSAAVDISLQDGLRVTVKDDGASPDAPGAGLRGMRARFTQFSGKLTVRRDRQGTTVEGVIPDSGLRRAAEPAVH
jgi:signal transduction histidine kinase